MNKTDILKRDFLGSILDDYVGLWELVCHADRAGIKNPQEMQRLILPFIFDMLSQGMIEAGVPFKGGDFKKSDGQPNELILKIKNDWDALGREPNPGEVIWFHLINKEKAKKEYDHLNKLRDLELIIKFLTCCKNNYTKLPTLIMLVEEIFDTPDDTKYMIKIVIRLLTSLLKDDLIIVGAFKHEFFKKTFEQWSGTTEELIQEIRNILENIKHKPKTVDEVWFGITKKGEKALNESLSLHKTMQ